MSCCAKPSPRKLVAAPFDACSGEGGSVPNQSAEKAAKRPLGRLAKSVDQAPDQAPNRERRRRLFRLQRQAAKLLPGERVSKCKWAVVSKEKGVDVCLTTYERGIQRASFAGLQTCGSVWHCPVCASRISETRRGELNKLLAWARSKGLRPVMVTLTARHGIRDKLPKQLDAMKRAKQRLRQRREWRRIKGRIAGTVTATEVTYGGHGWHTHFHEIILVKAEDEAAALAVLDGLGRVWRACLVGVGLSGGRAAWKAQGAAAAGRYVGKWGAAEEMTLTGSKEAKGKGRTPQQLLEDAAEGDEESGKLWQTFALAFKGRRQLVWSPGLKARAGIDELSDSVAAEDEGQEDAELVEVIDNISEPEWRSARKKRPEILDAAEIEGASGVRRIVSERHEPPPDSPPKPADQRELRREKERDAELQELLEFFDIPHTKEKPDADHRPDRGSGGGRDPRRILEDV